MRVNNIVDSVLGFLLPMDAVAAFSIRRHEEELTTDSDNPPDLPPIESKVLDDA